MSEYVSQREYDTILNNLTMIKQTLYFLTIVIFFQFLSCTSDSKKSTTPTLPKNTLFQKLAPTATGIDFINEVQDGKDFNVLTYRNFYNGGGVGIGDFNNDGLQDVFFTANMASNKLYLNKGDWQFEDISDAAGIAGKRGWSTGVSLVDINADGFVDIYVSNSGDIAGDDRENELYINNGDLTFSEQAKDYNLANAGFSTHASFFDYDMDGDLDCYILNNSFKDPSKLRSFSKTREEDDLLGGDRLMRNDNGRFVDVSAAAGIYTSGIGFGLGVSVSDINNDFLPDIYISNDFWERDYIYINQGDGTFSEELSDRVAICSVSSMGADIADLNNDGAMDIFTTDMLAADNYRLKAMTVFDPVYLDNLKYRSSFHYQELQNCLQINDGQGNFQELASMSDAAATDWSWGALIFDFDNDGKNDIYVCNGIYKNIMDQDFTNFIADKDEVKKIVTERGEFDFRDFLPYLSSTPLSNYAFVNQGNNQFKNQAAALGFGEANFSNGAAYGDMDNDGDLDLIINNVNMSASVYKNMASQKGNHFLKINLQQPTSKNQMAIGTTVEVSTPTQTYTQQHYIVRGFQSSVAAGLTFGLGDDTTIEKIKVIWPDQTEQVINNISVDTTLNILKNTNKKTSPISNSLNYHLVASKSIKNSQHQENTFNDFDRERMLPRMHSTEGPAILKGDIDNDGHLDLVALGATGDVDKIFLQNTTGQFIRKQTTAFDADKSFESVCGALYDNDKDGDLDLLIGSGGNDFSKGMDGFLLRYYENDGKGNFSNIKAKTPPAGGQFSAIRPCDFDKDGDMDLFIAGRSIPGNYGLTPRSFLLKREGNSWIDITEKELGTAGMITDALWTDYDMDGDDDLLLVGEWMPITIFSNEGNSFRKSTIDNTAGWWLDINANDLDNDGDMDYVLGNWGLNSKFKASQAHPLSLYVKDFDKNGKSEFILNWKPPGENKVYPFPSKMDITAQMPSLKKRFLKYEEYANADYQKLFTAAERKGAITRKANTLNSAILRNNNGQYQLESLPFAAQVAPMFTSVIDDFNKDGIKDIWMGGNFYGLKPEVGRHNSSKGVLLLGDTNGGYELGAAAPITGEIRDAHIVVNRLGQKRIIVGVNNGAIEVLTY